MKKENKEIALIIISITGVFCGTFIGNYAYSLGDYFIGLFLAIGSCMCLPGIVLYTIKIKIR